MQLLIYPPPNTTTQHNTRNLQNSLNSLANQSPEERAKKLKEIVAVAFHMLSQPEDSTQSPEQAKQLPKQPTRTLTNNSYTTALGVNATIDNSAANSVAIGYKATIQSGSTGSIVIGSGAQAQYGSVQAGGHFLAVGSPYNVVIGSNAIIFPAVISHHGSDATMGESIAIGLEAQIQTGSPGSIAIGSSGTVGAYAQKSIAVGYNATVQSRGSNSIAQGYGATVGSYAYSSIAQGHGATVSNYAPQSIAIGAGAQAQATGAVAFGNNAINSVQNSMLLNSSSGGTGYFFLTPTLPITGSTSNTPPTGINLLGIDPTTGQLVIIYKA